MVRALRPVVALAGALAVLAGCGTDAGPIAETCTRSTATIVRALATAPAAAALPDGTKLSDCVHRALADADLQNLGIVLTAAAAQLREQAQGGDLGAATRLGYLIGAVRRGAAGTAGVAAELQRRMELVGGRLQDSAPAAVDAAVERGLSAGAARG